MGRNFRSRRRRFRKLLIQTVYRIVNLSNDYAEPMRENRLTPEEIKKITLERKERWKKYKEEYEEFFGEEFELELADDRSTGKK